MRYIIFVFLFCFSVSAFSQYKPEKSSGLFYKISLASSLKVNEDYTINTEDDETFLEPNAIFFNNTIGYQFDYRASIGLNIEYDVHYQQNLNFFPVYLSFHYNILVKDDNLFLRGGYGSLAKLTKKFEAGNLYRLGLGYQIFDQNYRNSYLIGFDFTRKRFGYKTLEGLSSLSIFLEFRLF